MSTLNMHYLPSQRESARMSTDELRMGFLVTDLWRAGECAIRFVDLDRVALGGVVPVADPVALPNPPELAAEFFCERREIGVLNIGGPGTVRADGRTYPLARRDGLFIGRGSRDVLFASDDAARPARFYLVSYPAHATHPTTRVTPDEVYSAELGSQEGANRRTLRRYFHPEGVQTAQLVMGVTTLAPGSVWNTMPPHTHARRTEVYLYFDIPADAVVFHMMGAPQETRDLVVRDGDVVLSPGWSIHAGVGTAAYTFCWAMGGENQAFADMQGVDMTQLR